MWKRHQQCITRNIHLQLRCKKKNVQSKKKGKARMRGMEEKRKTREKQACPWIKWKNVSISRTAPKLRAQRPRFKRGFVLANGKPSWTGHLEARIRRCYQYDYTVISIPARFNNESWSLVVQPPSVLFFFFFCLFFFLFHFISFERLLFLLYRKRESCYVKWNTIRYWHFRTIRQLVIFHRDLRRCTFASLCSTYVLRTDEIKIEISSKLSNLLRVLVCPGGSFRRELFFALPEDN